MPLSPANTSDGPLKIAVVGSGVAALSSAWLLAQRHRVTVYEKAERLGGHSNTVTAAALSGDVAVDTGFICFNDATYPNLIALFTHLGVQTRATDMSFAVSLEEGRFEYAAPGLFAQRRNLLRPRFWSMLSEVLRFYRQAPIHLGGLTDPDLTLGDYLKREGFSEAFRDDHLLPMAAAGEIEGVLRRDGGNPIEGLGVELIDAEGRVRATTITEFDGYFLFEGVAYGRYTVRLGEASAAALRASASQPFWSTWAIRRCSRSRLRCTRSWQACSISKGCSKPTAGERTPGGDTGLAFMIEFCPPASKIGRINLPTGLPRSSISL